VLLFFQIGESSNEYFDRGKILTGFFLCSSESSEVLAALKPEWNEKCKLPLNQKLLIINSSYSLLKFFHGKKN
jgi:hypothetical protein